VKLTAYAAGTPCWIDLGTPDIAATNAFYTGLFGWTANEGPPEAGGYVIYNLGDSAVAGAGPLMSADQPPTWTTYFATDDAAATASRVEAAGGKTLMAPMQVMDIGHMGLFMDDSGAVFGAWQKISFFGAALVNEPGTLTWNELMSQDVEAAQAFYHQALGLGAKSDAAYTEFLVDDRPVAGMMDISGPEWPPDLPSHWMVYFAVADADATVAKVVELGGKVSVPPTDTPIGRFSVVSDPQGAFFSVIALDD
jgi:predicted enzyme related to lactoylglutathione lyase